MAQVCLFNCNISIQSTTTISLPGKRLRLPILLRTPKIECSFENDECGINQSLDQFELHQNTTYIAGRCQYYQFSIEKDHVPLQVAKFQTTFFPNLDSSTACLHVEVNVQGKNTFLLVVSQRTRVTAPRVVYSHFMSPTSPTWKTTEMNMQLGQEESQFIFEVLCQWCSKGSKFSISHISFAWENCDL